MIIPFEIEFFSPFIRHAFYSNIHEEKVNKVRIESEYHVGQKPTARELKVKKKFKKILNSSEFR